MVILVEFFRKNSVEALVSCGLRYVFILKVLTHLFFTRILTETVVYIEFGQNLQTFLKSFWQEAIESFSQSFKALISRESEFSVRTTFCFVPLRNNWFALQEFCLKTTMYKSVENHSIGIGACSPLTCCFKGVHPSTTIAVLYI